MPTFMHTIDKSYDQPIIHAVTQTIIKKKVSTYTLLVVGPVAQPVCCLVFSSCF